jgi:hypothetical protein
MVMNGIVTIPGEPLLGPEIPADQALALIQRLQAEHPEWCRTQLSRELCQHWDWRRPNGQWRDMACRDLLLKLERAGQLVLPPRRGVSPNALRNRVPLCAPHATDPIQERLDALTPLSIAPATVRTADAQLFNTLVARYHYLGLRNTVGANLKYLIRDRHGRPLACMLFGSAAWKTAARDAFIGWDERARRRHLPLLTNNTRFIILPWVRVDHLASHVLSRVLRRLGADWLVKYGYRPQLVETFVDRSRFRGTCYRAANWIHLGATTGRSRQDRDHTLQVGVKDLFVYPLQPHFREALCHDDA